MRIGTGQGVLLVQAAQLQGEAEATAAALVQQLGFLDGETFDLGTITPPPTQ